MIAVRDAAAHEFGLIQAIDLSAGERFRDTHLAHFCGDAIPRDMLSDALADRLLWVADDDGATVGFLAATDDGDTLFVSQVSVAQSAQGRGVGAALLDHVAASARDRGKAGVTLTTQNDIAWNAPYYARRGFVDVTGDACPPVLARRLAAELTRGLDTTHRVAMLLPLGR